MHIRKNNGGYVAMLAVIMIATAGLFIATTAAWIGIGEMKSALALTNGERTLSFVEGCAEDALQKTWTSPLYAGGSIVRPEGTCTVAIVKTNPQWVITVSTTATDYVRTIQATINRYPNAISLVSWREL